MTAHAIMEPSTRHPVSKKRKGPPSLWYVDLAPTDKLESNISAAKSILGSCNSSLSGLLIDAIQTHGDKSPESEKVRKISKNIHDVLERVTRCDEKAIERTLKRYGKVSEILKDQYTKTAFYKNNTLRRSKSYGGPQ